MTNLETLIEQGNDSPVRSTRNLAGRLADTAQQLTDRLSTEATDREEAKAEVERLKAALAVAEARANGVAPETIKVKAPNAKVSDAALIRAWAVENGVEVTKRGRLSQTVVALYQRAQAAARDGSTAPVDA
jgi:hypothetical protein